MSDRTLVTSRQSVPVVVASQVQLQLLVVVRGWKDTNTQIGKIKDQESAEYQRLSAEQQHMEKLPDSKSGHADSFLPPE